MEEMELDYFLVLGILFISLFLLFFNPIMPFKTVVEGTFLSPPDNFVGACSDNDGGIYPSTQGTVVSSNYNYGRNIDIVDVCYNSSRVIDYGCAIGDNKTYAYRTYDCSSGCNSGACSTTRESYFLNANFSNNGTADVVKITNLANNNLVCENVIAGNVCAFGNIDLSVDELFVLGDNKWGRFSFGSAGTPFRVVFDDLHNKITLPISTELPLDSYTFKVLDRDGSLYEGAIQEITAYWANGEIKLNYSSMLPYKSHHFTFEVIGNHLEINFPVSGGVATIPVLFGFGSDFQGLGIDGNHLFVTSGINFVSYNQTQNVTAFSVSRSGGGFVNNQGIAICEAKIVANVSNCLLGDKREISYLSDNSCATNLPASRIYERCDYEDNGFIGNLSDVDANFNFSVYENGRPLNLSERFNDTRNIEIDEEGDIRVEFTFAFNNNDIDLTNLHLRKQANSDSKGYLIVNGLDVNKTVYLDKLSNVSNAVCVKDEEINSISSISNDCSKSGETIVLCDGSNSTKFSCIEQGGDYKVSGLRHSAVKEFQYVPGSCSPLWSCSEWGSCVSGSQTRLCTDSRNCGVNLAKPLESQSCSSVISSEVKTCSQLGGKICQINQECSIGTESASDGDCCKGICSSGSNESSSGFYFWVVVAVLIIGIIAIIVMIILSLRNKSIQKSLGEFDIS